jgi:hypothetical protein
MTRPYWGKICYGVQENYRSYRYTPNRVDTGKRSKETTVRSQSSSDGMNSCVNTIDESPRLPAVMRLRRVPLAEPQSDGVPYAVESRTVQSGYSRDSRRLMAAAPDARADIPNNREAELDWNITASLHRRLNRGRLLASGMYLDPRTTGTRSDRIREPVSIAEIVEWIAYLYEYYTNSLEELYKQRLANGECDDVLIQLRNVQNERQHLLLRWRMSKQSSVVSAARCGAAGGRVPNRSVGDTRSGGE